MKKWFCAALGALLMLALCAGALAAGNVTIVAQDRDGFDDYISSMFVWDGRLLMSSWDKLYVYTPGEKGVTEVEGFDQLQGTLNESISDPADGTGTLKLGDTEIELDENESVSLNSQIIVAGDKLYRTAFVYGDEGLVSSLLVELCIAPDGAVSLGEMIDLSDALNVDYGDGYVGQREIQQPCYADGILYCLSYGEDGRELLSIDLESGEAEVLTLDTDNDVNGMAAFTEGKLLLVTTSYGESMEAELLVYDLASEEVQSLGALPCEGWDAPAGIAYDEARGMIYYVLGGSVWRMPVSEDGMGEPQEFGDMPLDVYTDSNAVVLGDLYIIASYDGVVGRDVTAEKLPDERLRIVNRGYIQEMKRAYYDFTDAHPEYMVSISDGSGADTLLQDMMNRSPDVDIYSLSMTSGTFSALMNRGFMAELSGSETLSAEVGAMYDSVKNAVMKDGELYAVPMSMYANCLSINKKLLTEKLGYTEEQMPKTWVDVFGLIADLAATRKLEEFPEVSLLGPGYTEYDVKFNIFAMMMNSYYVWLDAQEMSLTVTSAAQDTGSGKISVRPAKGNMDSAGSMLETLCTAFEAIDWSAFNLPAEYEEDGEWEYDEANILFSNENVQPSSYRSMELEPVVLAMADGEAPMIGAEITVMFVNPFSTHREAAIEYLEKTLALMDDATRISLMPEENEPILSPWYEENMKYYDEEIANLEEQLSADDLDEEDRDLLEQNLADMTQWREEYAQEGQWQVSPEAIERYRVYAQYLVPMCSAIWEGDTYTQIDQYMGGAITAKQLCDVLEKTLQMQRLEGQ